MIDPNTPAPGALHKLALCIKEQARIAEAEALLKNAVHAVVRLGRAVPSADNRRVGARARERARGWWRWLRVE
jgi:hypothetical protein